MKSSAILSLLTKQAIVEKVDGKYVLWTKDRSRRLGTHDTARQAYAQEAAIQHSQAGDPPPEKKAAAEPDYYDRLNSAIDKYASSLPVGREKTELAQHHGKIVGSCGHTLQNTKCGSMCEFHPVATVPLQCMACSSKEKSASALGQILAPAGQPAPAATPATIPPPAPVSLPPQPAAPATVPVNPPPTPQLKASAVLGLLLKRAGRLPFMLDPSGTKDPVTGRTRIVPDPSYNPAEDPFAQQPAAGPPPPDMFKQRGGVMGMAGGAAESVANTVGRWIPTLDPRVAAATNWIPRAFFGTASGLQNLGHNWDYFMHGKGEQKTYVPPSEAPADPNRWYDYLPDWAKGAGKYTGLKGFTNGLQEGVESVGNAAKRTMGGWLAPEIDSPEDSRGNRDALTYGYWTSKAKADADVPGSPTAPPASPPLPESVEYKPQLATDLMPELAKKEPTPPPKAPTPPPLVTPPKATAYHGNSGPAGPTAPMAPVPQPKLAARLKLAGWGSDLAHKAVDKFHLLDSQPFDLQLPKVEYDQSVYGDDKPISRFLFDQGTAAGHTRGFFPELGNMANWAEKLLGSPLYNGVQLPAQLATVNKLFDRDHSWKELFRHYQPSAGAFQNPDPRFEKLWRAWLPDPDKDDSWAGRASSAAHSFASGFGPLVTNTMDQLQKAWQGPPKPLGLSDIIR